MQNARPGVFEEDVHVDEVEVQDAAVEPDPQDDEHDMPALQAVPEAETMRPGAQDMVGVSVDADITADSEEIVKSDSEQVIASAGVAILPREGPSLMQRQHLNWDEENSEGDEHGRFRSPHRPLRGWSLSSRPEGMSSSEGSQTSTVPENDSTSSMTCAFKGEDDMSLVDYPYTLASDSPEEADQQCMATDELSQLTPLTFASVQAHTEAMNTLLPNRTAEDDSRTVKKARVPQRPGLPNINLSAQEFQEDLRNSSPSPGLSTWEPQPQPSPSLSTYNAPEQLEGGISALPLESDQREEYFPQTNTPHDSDGGSEISSAAATVLDSASKEEDIFEYFAEEDAASDDDDEEARQQAQVVIEAVPQEDNAIEDNNGEPNARDDDARAADEVDVLNEDDVDGALEGSCDTLLNKHMSDRTVQRRLV